MRKIVIIGGGFSGIAAARTLKKRLVGMKRLEITLVSERSHFVASPNLTNIATGDEKIAQITTHLSKLVSAPIKIEIDRVSSIHPLEKSISLESGAQLDYDFAIQATGTQLDWRGLEPNSHVIGCKKASDFLDVQERVIASLTRANEMLEKGESAIEALCTFVVIGAGPTGITLAAKLTVALKNRYLSEYSSELRKHVSVILVDADDRVLTEFPDLSPIAGMELERLGVDLRLKLKVENFNEKGLLFDNGETLDSENLFWCGGVQRISFLDEKRDRVCDASLRHLDYRELYIVGDAVDEQPITMNAHCAVAQGRLAASNIIADLSGRKASRWSNKGWPMIIDLGETKIAINSRGDVLQGRSARIYAKASRAKLLKEWMGSYSTWKFLMDEMLKKTSSTFFLEE